MGRWERYLGLGEGVTVVIPAGSGEQHRLFQMQPLTADLDALTLTIQNQAPTATLK